MVLDLFPPFSNSETHMCHIVFPPPVLFPGIFYMIFSFFLLFSSDLFLLFLFVCFFMSLTIHFRSCSDFWNQVNLYVSGNRNSSSVSGPAELMETNVINTISYQGTPPYLPTPQQFLGSLDSVTSLKVRV